MADGWAGAARNVRAGSGVPTTDVASTVSSQNPSLPGTRAVPTRTLTLAPRDSVCFPRHACMHSDGIVQGERAAEAESCLGLSPAPPTHLLPRSPLCSLC